eukprot:g2107.t1
MATSNLEEKVDICLESWYKASSTLKSKIIQTDVNKLLSKDATLLETKDAMNTAFADLTSSQNYLEESMLMRQDMIDCKVIVGQCLESVQNCLESPILKSNPITG